MTFGTGTFGVGTFGAPAEPAIPGLEIRPGTELRIRAFHVESGVTYPVWRGFIENVEESFDPSERPVAKFGCHDGYAQVAHINLPEQTPVGAGETSDARVHRLLDLAEWPDEQRDVDPGRVTVQATNLARALIDDMGITADSEGGALFSAKDGTFTFRNRDWLRIAPYATEVQATVGEESEDVCGAGYSLQRPGGDIVNDVQMARANGTLQRVTNETSVGQYRRRTYNRSDLVCETDEQVRVLANRVLQSRSPGTIRMNRVVIRPTSPEEFEFCLAVDYGWRIEIHYRPQAGQTSAAEWVRQVHVQGIAHKVGTDSWETELRVDDAYASPVDVWDNPTVGHGWDHAKWGEAA